MFDGSDASLNLDEVETLPFQFYVTNFRKKRQQYVDSLAGAAPC